MAPITLKIKGKNFMPFFEMDTEDELQKTWRVCTRIKDSLENGSRLENLSWRLWFLHYKKKKFFIKKSRNLATLLANRFDPLPDSRQGWSKDRKKKEGNANGKPVGSTTDASTLLSTGSSAPTADDKHESFITSTSLNIEFQPDGAIAVSGDIEDLLGGFGTNFFLDPLMDFIPSDDMTIQTTQPAGDNLWATEPLTDPAVTHEPSTAPATPSEPSSQPRNKPTHTLPAAQVASSTAPHASLAAAAAAAVASGTSYAAINMQSYSPHYSSISPALLEAAESVEPVRHIASKSWDTYLPALNGAAVARPPPSIYARAQAMQEGSPNGSPNSASSSRSSSLPPLAHSNPQILTPNPSTYSQPQSPSYPAMGATFAPHVKLICVNCNTTSTPLWRRSADGHPLCNACGLYQKQHNQNRPKQAITPIPPTSTPSKESREPLSSTDNLVCSNCGTTKTPLWRRSDEGSILCNACGLYRKLHNDNRPISMKTDVIKKRQRYENGTGPSAAKRAKKEAAAAAAAAAAVATGGLPGGASVKVPIAPSSAAAPSATAPPLPATPTPSDSISYQAPSSTAPVYQNI